ncbi:hypothetical protein RvY_02241-2 [Ramazzottius varieornatus]|nr:hypothetical protein RvY_02241-2 [Ramazzottius varieornatus]
MHTVENMREIIQLKIVETAVTITTKPPETTTTSTSTTPTILFPSAEDIIDSLTDITTEKLDSIADAVESMALAALQDVKVAQSMVDVVGAVMNVDKGKLDTALTVENSEKLVSSINFYTTGVIIPNTSYQLRMEASNVEINLLDLPADFADPALELQSQTLSSNASSIYQSRARTNQEVSLSIPLTIAMSKTDPDGNCTKRTRVSFVVYHNSKLYKQREPIPATVVMDGNTVALPDNPVIVADVPQVETTNLAHPITFRIQKPLSSVYGLNYTCVYWNSQEKQWSTEGVHLVSQTEDEVECEAYHMTAFSILFDPTREIIISVAHKLALSIVSYIGCAISCIGCLITTFTYVFFKYLHSDRSGRILINLCLAIALLNACFLFGSVMGEFPVEPIPCAVISTAVHFFALASFMWMGIEAFNMYTSLIKVFSNSTSQSILKQSISGWGLPFLVSTGTTVTDFYLGEPLVTTSSNVDPV